MDHRYIFVLATGLATFNLHGQAPLNALNVPLTINLQNTLPGVNNGAFAAMDPAGAIDPIDGQLDLDAWDYFADGTGTQATQNASVFPGTLPMGNGLNAGGVLITGLNAVDLDGQRCIGIQPTGGHFTAGNITLRAVNNTGSTVDQLAVTFTLYVFNDRDRSNSYNLFYSANNDAGSYVQVPEALIITPLTADVVPEWLIEDRSITISGISLAPGAFIHLRWVGQDNEGSGQRDEVALGGISLTAQQNTAPNLFANVTGLPTFAQTIGTPSAAASANIGGSNLTGMVNVNVTAPFEVSLNGTSGFGASVMLTPTGGTLASTPVFVRLNSALSGPATGLLTASSTGANTVQVNLSGATSGGGLPTLFLNELMSSNLATISDENDEFDDWFEIYNPNSFDVDLAGWYVSDAPAQLNKYQFDPAAINAVVPANGWLLVWADNQPLQGNLHTNFSLSSTNGEALLLVGPDAVTIVDQIVFGPLLDDVSYGRQSDGAAPWVEFTTPTPGASNNTSNIAEHRNNDGLRAWPVPAHGPVLYLDRAITANVHDLGGRIVASVSLSSMIDIGALAPGTYVIRTDAGHVLRFTRQ